MHTSTTSTAHLVPWSAQALAQVTQGVWQGDIPTTEFKRILTDSRHAEAGDVFLALKGERFDAHDFLAQVEQQGCTLAIVERYIENIEITQLVVSDTRLALGALGAYRRQQYPHLKVVALTGSSGKTTTKEMLGSILNRLAPTLTTRGNLNNDLGVPMMLLELCPEHQYAVMELGANHQGEIDYTSGLVQPHVAGILNIGTAHLGEFGGREGICTAKSEIYRHVAVDGYAILPTQDDFTSDILKASAHLKQLSFGEGGDIYATNIQLHAQSTQFLLHTPDGSEAVHLPFAGLHNVYNALSACACAVALGLSLQDIAQGLAHAIGVKGRLNFVTQGQHLFIDDTYNANPTSMRAAAQVLTKQSGFKVFVMGDIGELGDDAVIEHQKLGHDLSQMPLDAIVTVGEYALATQQGQAEANKIHAFKTQTEALSFLINMTKKHQPQTISFLFKGSRYTHMETLMADVMEKL